MKLLSIKQNNKGFTLLEILVVISIIGILIAIGASAYSTAQKKSRDARRTGDMKAMQNAFEQFYTVNDSEYDTCANMAAGFSSGILPADPKDGAYPCDGDADSYCTCAELESGTGNASNGTCSYSAGGAFFCVSNLQ